MAPGNCLGFNENTSPRGDTSCNFVVGDPCDSRSARQDKSRQLHRPDASAGERKEVEGWTNICTPSLNRQGGDGALACVGCDKQRWIRHDFGESNGPIQYHKGRLGRRGVSPRFAAPNVSPPRFRPQRLSLLAPMTRRLMDDEACCQFVVDWDWRALTKIAEEKREMQTGLETRKNKIALFGPFLDGNDRQILSLCVKFTHICAATAVTVTLTGRDDWWPSLYAFR